MAQNSTTRVTLTERHLLKDFQINLRENILFGMQSATLNMRNDKQRF